MRLHIVSLPHTATTRDYLTCAYTQKVVKGCKMFLNDGHEVLLYSSDENEAPCTEHVPLISYEDRKSWGFGDGFDTALTPFLWDARLPYWATMNARAITEIRKRIHDRHDLLLLLGGWCQHPISVALSPMTTLEWGIGYEGWFSKYCAFESYAWMHHVYGLRAGENPQGNWRNGQYYHRVIPNFFDPDDFPHRRRTNGKGDYLLFIGRAIERKGPHVAAAVAERIGLPLVVAGPGVKESGKDWMVLHESNFRIGCASGLDVVGTVGVKERAELMAGARAVLVPTIYIEPFGGVAVEAMLAGTPAVTSDWGAFVETVEPGITGERFRTLKEGVEAVERASKLDRGKIRKRAISRYSLPVVGKLFDQWFQRIDELWEGGWYA